MRTYLTLSKECWFFFQKYKMNFDKNTGVIEMIMESLTPADEGTFTFQLQDGKATNQSSLVLIGDGMFYQDKQGSSVIIRWCNDQRDGASGTVLNLNWKSDYDH